MVSLAGTNLTHRRSPELPAATARGGQNITPSSRIREGHEAERDQAACSVGPSPVGPPHGTPLHPARPPSSPPRRSLPPDHIQRPEGNAARKLHTKPAKKVAPPLPSSRTSRSLVRLTGETWSGHQTSNKGMSSTCPPWPPDSIISDRDCRRILEQRRAIFNAGGNTYHRLFSTQMRTEPPRNTLS